MAEYLIFGLMDGIAVSSGSMFSFGLKNVHFYDIM